jgi:uncharacterized protein YyaL (SSP411 family)
MLYDNTQLARVYLHAWQVTGSEFFRTITEESLDNVVREMMDQLPSDSAMAGRIAGFYDTSDDHETMVTRPGSGIWYHPLPSRMTSMALRCHHPSSKVG